VVYFFIICGIPGLAHACRRGGGGGNRVDNVFVCVDNTPNARVHPVTGARYNTATCVLVSWASGQRDHSDAAVLQFVAN
jgi:hypothetical protein